MAPGAVHTRVWIEEVALRFASDECLLWPFTRTVKGYPQLKEQGKVLRAHREVCRLAHGEPPTPQHHAAHSCGTRLCCNKKHLRWATVVENNADIKTHGRAPIGIRSGSAKLTEREVRSIRKSRRTQIQLANKFGVSQSTISGIKCARTWKHI